MVLRIIHLAKFVGIHCVCLLCKYIIVMLLYSIMDLYICEVAHNLNKQKMYNARSWCNTIKTRVGHINFLYQDWF